MRSRVCYRGCDLAYDDDCFAPPWLPVETVLLVHGVAESAQAWTEWVPQLSGSFRVVRPDLPGFGDSSVPDGFRWSLENQAECLIALMNHLELQRVHVVGAKFGGTLAMYLASEIPDRVLSLSVFGSPAT